jgi:hypothetical protein
MHGSLVDFHHIQAIDRRVYSPQSPDIDITVKSSVSAVPDENKRRKKKLLPRIFQINNPVTSYGLMNFHIKEAVTGWSSCVTIKENNSGKYECCWDAKQIHSFQLLCGREIGFWKIGDTYINKHFGANNFINYVT